VSLCGLSWLITLYVVRFKGDTCLYRGFPDLGINPCIWKLLLSMGWRDSLRHPRRRNMTFNTRMIVYILTLTAISFLGLMQG
jgi:hypothetical protein